MYVFLTKSNAYCDKFMPKNPHKELMNASSKKKTETISLENVPGEHFQSAN
jgi:hypothetical protein